MIIHRIFSQRRDGDDKPKYTCYGNIKVVTLGSRADAMHI